MRVAQEFESMLMLQMLKEMRKAGSWADEDEKESGGFGAQTMFDTIGGAMALASLPLMLLHTDATSPTAIEAFSVDQRVATQRRRLRR